MDIDKLTQMQINTAILQRFSTLLDIDKLTHSPLPLYQIVGFSTLLDIDKLTQKPVYARLMIVLVLCWILINLHY